MAVSAAQLASLSPGVDPELIQQHLARLDRRYFARFAPEEVAGHLAALSGLTAERPVSVTFLVQPSGDLACTVLAFETRRVLHISRERPATEPCQETLPV